MSFEAEWAQHKASAAAQMQLNQAEPAPDGGGGTLQSDYDGKKRAAEYVDTTLIPHTQTAGRMAGGGATFHPPMIAPQPPSPLLNPGAASGTRLRAWGVRAGLDEALQNWDRSVQNLTGRLNGESAALKGARTTLFGGDGLTFQQFNGLTVPGTQGSGN